MKVGARRPTPVTMASIIIADENEGRRNLLAGSIEREGFQVTRTGTLRQCEGTALATMPDVVLIDGEWQTGDAIDAASRLSSDPEFELKCRIVVLSSQSGEDYLVSATKAGVSEVLSKPVDMNKLLVQLDKHAKKMFVPPPAEVETGSGTGFFDVSITPGDPSWSLPILRDLLGEDSIDSEFVSGLLSRVKEDEGIDIDVDDEVMEKLLRAAFDELILGAEVEIELGDDEELIFDEDEELTDEQKDERRKQQRKSRRTEMRSRLVEAMEEQSEEIQLKLEGDLEKLTDPPEKVAILTPDTGLVHIDPNALEMTRLTIEVVRDLLWEMGLPIRENLAMYSTQVEDATQMLEDSLASLPEQLQTEDAESNDADGEDDSDADEAAGSDAEVEDSEDLKVEDAAGSDSEE